MHGPPSRRYKRTNRRPPYLEVIVRTGRKENTVKIDSSWLTVLEVYVAAQLPLPLDRYRVIVNNNNVEEEDKPDYRVNHRDVVEFIRK